jgi:hypothetical protein
MISPVRSETANQLGERLSDTHFPTQGSNREHEGKGHGSEDGQVHGRFLLVQGRRVRDGKANTPFTSYDTPAAIYLALAA